MLNIFYFPWASEGLDGVGSCIRDTAAIWAPTHILLTGMPNFFGAALHVVEGLTDRRLKRTLTFSFAM
jgi:hypothetical protein